MRDLYDRLFQVLDSVPGLCGEEAGRIARQAELAAEAAQHACTEHAHDWTLEEIMAREG